MASEPLLSETRNSYSGAQTLNAIMNQIGATVDADFSKYARQLRENAVNNVQTLKLQDMDDLLVQYTVVNQKKYCNPIIH